MSSIKPAEIPECSDGNTHPNQDIPPTHSRSTLRTRKKKSRKSRLPTHDGAGVSECVAMLVAALFTGSAILSSPPPDQGDASPAQVAVVHHGKLIMGHHVYDKSRGWLKQAARVKPMVRLYSRVDMSAYRALGLKPPAKKVVVSGGQHLADTGASICLGGRSYMRSLGLTEEDLTPCDMSVCGANSSSIKILGALLVEFSQGSHDADLRSKQIIYICDGVVGALLSLEACVDLGLVEDKFPHVATVQQSSAGSNSSPTSTKKENCECKCPLRARAPDVPDIPLEPEPKNVKKLQDWILEYYASSAFNCCECQALPAMHGPPLKIYMQEGVTPVASHSPIPVPIHWQKKVKAGLDRDVAIGVIERVPPGTPTTWCHKMVVVHKKDNTPRRTVNFQPLNQYSSRQTHHTMSPFHQATSVPKSTKKTVLDTWNGYHSV